MSRARMAAGNDLAKFDRQIEEVGRRLDALEKRSRPPVHYVTPARAATLASDPEAPVEAPVEARIKEFIENLQKLH